MILLKILILGDIEGRLPKGLKGFVYREDIDAVVSAGDFPDSEAITLFEFANWGAENKELAEKGYDSGVRILRDLDKLGVPVYVVFGNHDDFSDNCKGYANVVKKLKNVRNVHLKTAKLGVFTLVGHGGYEPKVLFHHKRALRKGEAAAIRRAGERIYRSVCRLMKGRRNVILLTHDVPHGCGMDTIRNPASPINGSHVGERAYSRVLSKCAPTIHVCGHMHENQGMERFKRTLLINGGFGREGECAVLELPSAKVRFLKL